MKKVFCHLLIYFHLITMFLYEWPFGRSHLLHISQSIAMGWIGFFAGPVLAAGPYVWHPWPKASEYYINMCTALYVCDKIKKDDNCLGCWARGFKVVKFCAQQVLHDKRGDNKYIWNLLYLFCATADSFSKNIWDNLYAWLISVHGITRPWGQEIILACYKQNRLQPSLAVLLFRTK